MLFKEQGYKAQSVADASTLVGWSSAVMTAKYVQGWCHSNAAVTVELWALRPRTNADHTAQGTVVLTSALGSDWRLIEGPLTVAADTLEPFSWEIAASAVRLLVNNASGGAATVDLEINTRTI